MGNTFITIHDKLFKPYISSVEISRIVSTIAQNINSLKLENCVFVSVLNGSFMFTADLCKEITCKPELHFIKVSSYVGVQSSGSVNEVIGLQKDLEGKNVFIIEDIIDTGKTIEVLYNKFIEAKASNVFVVTLLFKPNSFKAKIPIHFIGKEIENDFVVGYGMDYCDLGRELPEIYKID